MNVGDFATTDESAKIGFGIIKLKFISFQDNLKLLSDYANKS
jgi:hypothetical protein